MARRQAIAASGRRAVGADPDGEGVFIHLAGRDGIEGRGRIVIRRRQHPAVQFQKQARAQEGGALAPVDKGMVLGQADPVGRRQVADVLNALIAPTIERSGQGGFKQALSRKPGDPPVRART